jgi:hypothetical protein
MKSFLHRFGAKILVPRLAKSDELLLQATYQGSNVYDDCHASFDKLIRGQNAVFSELWVNLNNLRQ